MYKEFYKCHSFVLFLYFLFVISVTVFFNHPIITGISLFSSIICGVCLLGKRIFKSFFLFVLPLCLICGVLNPVFNHQGMTILMYFSDGNPLTLESVVYGGVSAMLLAGTLLWFVSFSAVMDSDKIIYLFGRAVPSLATIITMVMRLIPMYSNHFKQAYMLNLLYTGHTEKKRFRFVSVVSAALASVSATATWALENAVFTADSMTSRGYGSGKRSFYSDFRFTKRDVFFLLFLGLLAVGFFSSSLMGGGYAMYFPYIRFGDSLALNLAAYISFGAGALFPVYFTVLEALKWHFLK